MKRLLLSICLLNFLNIYCMNPATKQLTSTELKLANQKTEITVKLVTKLIFQEETDKAWVIINNTASEIFQEDNNAVKLLIKLTVLLAAKLILQKEIEKAWVILKKIIPNEFHEPNNKVKKLIKNYKKRVLESADINKDFDNLPQYRQEMIAKNLIVDALCAQIRVASSVQIAHKLYNLAEIILEPYIVTENIFLESAIRQDTSEQHPEINTVMSKYTLELAKVDKKNYNILEKKANNYLKYRDYYYISMAVSSLELGDKNNAYKNILEVLPPEYNFKNRFIINFINHKFEELKKELATPGFIQANGALAATSLRNKIALNCLIAEGLGSAILSSDSLDYCLELINLVKLILKSYLAKSNASINYGDPRLNIYIAKLYRYISKLNKNNFIFWQKKAAKYLHMVIAQPIKTGKKAKKPNFIDFASRAKATRLLGKIYAAISKESEAKKYFNSLLNSSNYITNHSIKEVASKNILIQKMLGLFNYGKYLFNLSGKAITESKRLLKKFIIMESEQSEYKSFYKAKRREAVEMLYEIYLNKFKNKNLEEQIAKVRNNIMKICDITKDDLIAEFAIVADKKYGHKTNCAYFMTIACQKYMLNKKNNKRYDFSKELYISMQIWLARKELNEKNYLKSINILDNLIGIAKNSNFKIEVYYLLAVCYKLLGQEADSDNCDQYFSQSINFTIKLLKINKAKFSGTYCDKIIKILTNISTETKDRNLINEAYYLLAEFYTLFGEYNFLNSTNNKNQLYFKSALISIQEILKNNTCDKNIIDFRDPVVKKCLKFLAKNSKKSCCFAFSKACETVLLRANLAQNN